MPSWLEPEDSHAVASTMRVFRACPVPDVGSSAACRGSNFHSLLKAQIPWPQGKTQGIFSIQPFFCENLSRKQLRIQLFADEFPTRTAQGIFLSAQGINSARREWQGISTQKPIRSPRRIRSRQNSSS